MPRPAPVGRVPLAVRLGLRMQGQSFGSPRRQLRQGPGLWDRLGRSLRVLRWRTVVPVDRSGLDGRLLGAGVVVCRRGSPRRPGARSWNGSPVVLGSASCVGQGRIGGDDLLKPLVVAPSAGGVAGRAGVRVVLANQRSVRAPDLLRGCLRAQSQNGVWVGRGDRHGVLNFLLSGFVGVLKVWPGHDSVGSRLGRERVRRQGVGVARFGVRRQARTGPRRELRVISWLNGCWVFVVATRTSIRSFTCCAVAPAGGFHGGERWWRRPPGRGCRGGRSRTLRTGGTTGWRGRDCGAGHPFFGARGGGRLGHSWVTMASNSARSSRSSASTNSRNWSSTPCRAWFWSVGIVVMSHTTKN